METWHRVTASVSQPWCGSHSSTAWSLQLDWRAWSILAPFYYYSYDIQTHHWCSFTALQSGNLMSLKLMNKNHLHYIIKHSVTVAVTLVHSLVVDVAMLIKEAVGSSIEVWQNFLDISNSFTSCMLLTSQQCLFNK